MRLKQIETFVAVVEHGSLRAAARALAVSQPAVSKSIRSLEVELHAQLIERTPHGVVMTPLGRMFFTRARLAHSELRKAQEEIAIGKSGGGTVAFGVGPVAAMLIAPSALARFHKQTPSACIRVMEGFPPALLPLVSDGSLDFAVGPRLESQLHPSLSFRPLYREEFAVVARKGHPLRHKRSLEELGAAEWVDLWKAGLPNGPLDQTFTAAGLEIPRQVVQCESYNLAVSILAQTELLALLSRRLLALPLAREALTEISVTQPSPQLTVGIFTRVDPPLGILAASMAKSVIAEARILARTGPR